METWTLEDVEHYLSLPRGSTMTAERGMILDLYRRVIELEKSSGVEQVPDPSSDQMAAAYERGYNNGWKNAVMEMGAAVNMALKERSKFDWDPREILP